MGVFAAHVILTTQVVGQTACPHRIPPRGRGLTTGCSGRSAARPAAEGQLVRRREASAGYLAACELAGIASPAAVARVRSRGQS